MSYKRKYFSILLKYFFKKEELSSENRHLWTSLCPLRSQKLQMLLWEDFQRADEGHVPKGLKLKWTFSTKKLASLSRFPEAKIAKFQLKKLCIQRFPEEKWRLTDEFIFVTFWNIDLKIILVLFFVLLKTGYVLKVFLPS